MNPPTTSAAPIGFPTPGQIQGAFNNAGIPNPQANNSNQPTALSVLQNPQQYTPQIPSVGGSIVNTLKQGGQSVINDVGATGANAQAGGGGVGGNIGAGLETAGNVAGDVAKTAGGLLGDVVAPLIPQGAKNAAGDAAGFINNNVSSLLSSYFPNVSPQLLNEVQRGLGNVLSTVTLGLANNEGIPARSPAYQSIESGTPSAEEGTTGAQTPPPSDGTNVSGGSQVGAFLRSKLAPIPTDIKTLTDNPDQVSNLADTFKNNFETSKDFKANKSNVAYQSAPALLGNSELPSVLQNLDTARTAAGTRIGNVVAKIGDTPTDISKALDTLEQAQEKLPSVPAYAQKQLDNIMTEFRELAGGNTNPEVSSVIGGRMGRGSINPDLIRSQVSGNENPIPSFADVVKTVQKYGGTDFTKNFGNQVGGVLNSFVHDISDAAKKVGGDEYSKAVDDYREAVNTHDALESKLGKQDEVTGRYDNADDIIKNIAKGENTTKNLFGAIQKVTGQDVSNLTNHAAIAQFAHDITNGVPVGNAIASTPGFIFSARSFLFRMARTMGIKATNDPDFILKAILERIGKSTGK